MPIYEQFRVLAILIGLVLTVLGIILLFYLAGKDDNDWRNK